MAGFAPVDCDFYTVLNEGGKHRPLNRANFFTLRKLLRASAYDLVVYHITAKTPAPWHRKGSWPKILADVVVKSLFRFSHIGWHYFHWLVCRSQVPLLVIDTQDVPRITKSESYWLDRCQFWFMRELPPNHMNLFLNMDHRCGDVVNIQRNGRLRKNFAKIRPFSLGFDPGDERPISGVEETNKTYDVFYAGNTHTTTVREKGVEELRALQKKGFRIFLPEKRLSKDDFFQACAQSWLVWSPEGLGWDCHRHYEALQARSVPLINFPTIERLHPFQQGEHCLYYRPEAGGLSEAIIKALENRKELLRIAENGRAHILRHHTHHQLVRHVLETYQANRK